MSKNNPKPYSRNNNSNRNINNKRNINKSKKDVVKDNKVKDNDLDVTTRIRIDDTRINDSDSLDTSFLEGRLEKKVNKNKKEKEKILKEDSVSKKALDTIRSIVFALAVIALIILCIVFVINRIPNIISNNNKSNNSVNKEVIENDSKSEEKIIDDNYLFIGDYHTENYDFGDYDYHYVKNSKDDFSVSDLVDSLDDNVYKYNPSVVIIELGINDLNDNNGMDNIIDNLSSIIISIKHNRPLAKIYIESLYPINRDIDDFNNDLVNDDISNTDIENLNSKIEDICKKNNISYLDVYKDLALGDKLNSKYTDDGVLLNEDGYNIIKNLISKTIKG